jgi:hypothetical protein
MRLKNGYLIDEDGKYIHREVNLYSDGPCPIGWEVHHCDGKKLNNDPENLIAIPKELHAEIHERFHIEKPSKWEIKNIILWRFLLRHCDQT